MRFSSFLPMLMLAAAPLQVQSQCSIYDLTATVAQVSPAVCEYLVTLDFEHTGTTNQFTVTGNGVNYGTFTYDQLPLNLGPFPAGAVPIVKEFLVKDAVFSDCKDDATATLPACNQSSLCDIFDVQVLTGDCNLNSLTYKIQLNFKTTNPGSDSFQVWAGNGQYLGLFPLGQLPVTIPNFPWDGDPVDYLKICIKDNPNCCETVEFPTPDCLQTPCSVSDLTAVADSCTSDSTYRLTLNFSLNNPGVFSQFGVWANSEFLGFFNLNDLPLIIDDFPWDGGPVDYVKVCVLNVTLPPTPQILCCSTIEFSVPNCLEVYPCGIRDLKVETDSCSSDSTFGAWINFALSDSTAAVDSFQVWANGDSLGTFAIDSLPLYIPDFPWNGGIFSYVKICTDNTPTCCIEYQFLAPGCLPYGPCSIKNIVAQTGACTSDSTYKVNLNFQASNPGDGTFVVWANGTVIDTFPLTAVPLTINEFPWSGDSSDVVMICINDSTSNTACCLEKKFDAPDCLFADSCAIRDVVVDPGACNPNDQTYSLVLDFEVDNPGNGFFELWAGNGTYLGYFPLDSLPLTIPEFPCTNTGKGVLKICINDNPDCCTVVEFDAPNCCGSTDPCEITDLAVQTGACNSNESYEVWLNFNVTNPLGDEFGVWANGEFLGTFPLDSLPLYIPEFPWNGGPNDVVKVCFTNNNGSVGCCKTLEFEVPDCISQPCEIYNLTVETGDCTSDSTYKVKIKFQVDNAPSDTFGVWANGELIGTFSLNQLPLVINDFPWGGGAVDVIKVCFVDPSDPAGSATCCRVKEFHVPDCIEPTPCEIYDFTVERGDCTSDSTYSITINFSVDNPPSDSFGLWANGEFFGNYNLNDLPLTISNFPWDGGPNDVVKVCFSSTPGTIGCCRVKEFAVPGCIDQGGPCEIYNMKVTLGDCTSDSTYTIKIDFDVDNPPADSFDLWANGEFFGSYSVNSLPLTIQNFPWDGGSNDVVKVCFNSTATSGGCCRVKEFAVPDCLDQGGPCEIYDLTVEKGDCTSDSTYSITINFSVDNPPADSFGLWANGVFFGNYNLNDLPLTISNFPWDGGPNDAVKVCFSSTPGTPGCCRVKEFAVPDCIDQGGPCEIYDLTVETGDCTSDSTYQVWIDFEVQNPPGNTFGLWINGEFYDTFPLDSLPLYIANFPWGGGQNDVIKVCFSNSGTVGCCRTKEFHVPDCIEPGGPCEIYNLKVETGDCTSDSTYQVWINFSVDNPPADEFGVWANGEFLGLFPLDSLPLYIPNFPWDGGSEDAVKVCFPATSGSPLCCRTKEFDVPDCFDQNCKIFDVHVVKTPCLCGQFFALVTFKHQNGGSGGVDIVGNGTNYGNFPYNYPQPIILGPLDGDGSTAYEFAVKDHLHPDCYDDFLLGKVDCMTSIIDPNNKGNVTLSPNPTANWLNVTAQLQNGTVMGETTVEIYHADGRLVRTLTVPNGSNFQLDVVDLQAGIYRLSLLAAAGRVEGTFAKQ